MRLSTVRVDSDGASARLAAVVRSQARISASSFPCCSRSGATRGSDAHAASTSSPFTDRRTGIVGRYPTMVGPSRATQRLG
jgi:hypothetical protein